MEVSGNEVDPPLYSEAEEFKLVKIRSIRKIRGRSEEVLSGRVEEEFDIGRDSPWAGQKMVFKAGSPQIGALDL